MNGLDKGGEYMNSHFLVLHEQLVALIGSPSEAPPKRALDCEGGDEMLMLLTQAIVSKNITNSCGMKEEIGLVKGHFNTPNIYTVV